MIIGGPGDGCADYLSTVNFNTFNEANNCKHYLETKLIRYVISQRKTTDSISPKIFTDVPVIDFTDANTFIDWSKNVKSINEQLCDYFGLTETERHEIDSKIDDIDEDE